MKKILTILLLTAVIVTACNNRQKYEIKSADKYEKTKASLEEVEKKNPSRFLAVNGYNKSNLVGQTVVQGTVLQQCKAGEALRISILNCLFTAKQAHCWRKIMKWFMKRLHPGEVQVLNQNILHQKERIV